MRRRSGTTSHGCWRAACQRRCCSTYTGTARRDEPVQPPARTDVPARRTMPRASLTAAVEAMAPSRREATLAAIDANLQTGHGVQSQDGGDVGGGRRVCPLPARRQQATHHRRRAPHRGAVPRCGHLAPGEPDAHPGVGGAAAGGQDPNQGGAARPPRIQAQAGVRPRRAGA